MSRSVEKDENYYKLTAFKQRENYISTISHDLKIPVIAQMRALELLSEGNLGKLNPKQKEMVDLTLESCKSVYEMLSAILASYKYENKNIVLCNEITNISKIINNSIRDYNDLIENKKIKIKLSISDLLEIYADEKQLQKAIKNIIYYCILSSDFEAEITIKSYNCNDKLQIYFSFENSFISQEKLSNMFNNYSTPNEKLDKLGINLSLSLAKQIIEAHNGKIMTENLISKNIYIVEIPAKILLNFKQCPVLS